ncbi:phosphoadenylyl-sulfate reductase [Reinekea thalattae]|uniref:Adenosine 5'-phosphosulfate reductase n=1 Tax=Reinekea thalattae TaxID=2593301 RepID=A0A5C8Z6L6_9GAMM|nr:phosphoadenylyl-sulfate reductase [Reinekea thalattae]TXR53572.1 phosphoadenylyl-sulfate reductase [Reinekea thalattae]
MTDLTSLQLELSALSPRDILKKAIAAHEQIALSFSGAEDVVLVDMLAKLKPEATIFTLDTGRLHSETYQFIEDVRSHYGIQIKVYSPEHKALEAFVEEKGLFSFYRDGHSECCGVRKTSSLKRALLPLDAWITGQRKDQSPTRTSVPHVEKDPVFQGRGDILYKYNPLANWSSEDVWNYIRMMEIPYNPLHMKGYKSIGCEPCTKPTLPNQHEREGRWWWEEATHKECGLHAGNLSAS